MKAAEDSSLKKWKSLSNVLFSSLLDHCSSARSSSPAAVGPDEGLDSAAESAAAAAASVFSSGRRVTRSQQGATNTTAKKYPLRQSRSSGSDTEANGESRREVDKLVKLSSVSCMS